MEKEAKKTDDEKMTDMDRRIKRIREDKTDRAARTLQKYVGFRSFKWQVQLFGTISVSKNSSQRRAESYKQEDFKNSSKKKSCST